MTASDRAEQQIAVYWDFENIHISLHEDEFGPRDYSRMTPQPVLVDVGAIMDYVSSLGSVSVNRAYCNWSYYGRYAEALSSYAVELIQMFPRSKAGKNGADIQMCVDLVEDLMRRPHVDLFVIVSGDSDYIGALVKVKQYGKRVIGIGVREATHRFFMRVCDEFKYYDTLLRQDTGRVETPGKAPSESDLPGAKRLLVAALQRLSAQSGDPNIKQAAVKPMMLRLDSAFDERNTGYTSFTDFVTACSDVVEVTKGEFDRLIRLKGNQNSVQPKVLTEARKLLTAAVTFLSRTKKEVPLSAVKPMMQKLDATFDVTKAGHLTFLAFVRAFPNVVRIEGEGSNRTLVLTCPADEGGYTMPVVVQPAPAPRPVVIPPGNVLGVAHRFHWDVLRDRPAPDWNEYYSGLKAALEREGIEADENTLKGVRQVLVSAKVLRPKTDDAGITLRPDLADEEAFQQLVEQFVSQQQIAAAIAALTAGAPGTTPDKP